MYPPPGLHGRHARAALEPNHLPYAWLAGPPACSPSSPGAGDSQHPMTHASMDLAAIDEASSITSLNEELQEKNRIIEHLQVGFGR